MNRLVGEVHTPIEVDQIARFLFDGEGTCTCGRVLKKLDAKLILATVLPTQHKMLIGAYCLMCSQRINMTLKQLRNVITTGKVQLEKVDRTIRKIQ